MPVASGEPGGDSSRGGTPNPELSGVIEQAWGQGEPQNQDFPRDRDSLGKGGNSEEEQDAGGRSPKPRILMGLGCPGQGWGQAAPTLLRAGAGMFPGDGSMCPSRGRRNKGPFMSLTIINSQQHGHVGAVLDEGGLAVQVVLCGHQAILGVHSQPARRVVPHQIPGGEKGSWCCSEGQQRPSPQTFTPVLSLLT